LARIRAIEANNTFVLLGHRQFAARRILDMAPALAILAEASPAVAAEYKRRLERLNVVSFSGDRGFDVQGWPAERNRLLGEWREAVDRDAAAAIERSGRRRAPIRLPIGASRPAAGELAPAPLQ
jgi:DNA primase